MRRSQVDLRQTADHVFTSVQSVLHGHEWAFVRGIPCVKVHIELPPDQRDLLVLFIRANVFGCLGLVSELQ